MTRYSRHGRAVEKDEAVDEDGILRDGFAVRVSLMDAMTPLQRAVAQNAARLHDGHGNAPGHRPGFVMRDTFFDERDKARAEYEAELCSAWRGSKPREIEVKSLTGDALEDAHAAYLEDVTNAWRGPRDSGKWW
jgi:hypothetical protein